MSAYAPFLVAVTESLYHVLPKDHESYKERGQAVNTRKQAHGTRSARHRHKKKRLRLLWLPIIVLLVAAAVLLWQQIGEGGEVVKPPAQGTNEPSEETEIPTEELSEQPTDEPTDQPTDKPDVEEDPSSGEADSQVTFAFVGDVMMAGTLAGVVEDKGYDYPFEYVAEALREADYTVANLETPITERGTAEEKQWVYRTSPKAIPAMQKAGIDLVNLANNHILDYGQEGLLDTFKHLSDAGLPYVGAGEDAEQAYAYQVVELKGIRVAFLGFSRVVPDVSWKAGANHPGVASTYDYTLPVEAVEAAEADADLVVIIAHWGDERVLKPNKHQVELARRYVDAGADLVIGGHPHVLQGIEHYHGKWIAYSLGNFVFTTNDKHPKTWDSAILYATCGSEGECELEARPVNNAYAQPKVLTDEEGERILRELSEVSLNTTISSTGKITVKNETAEWELEP